MTVAMIRQVLIKLALYLVLHARGVKAERERERENQS